MDLYKLDDNFDMYIEIAKKANNSRPCELSKIIFLINSESKKNNFLKKLL